MSYNKTTWANGDVITAEKLNHMEEGISECADDIFIIHVDSEWDADNNPQSLSVRESKSWIQEEFASGKVPLMIFDGTLYPEALDNFHHANYGGGEPVDYLMFQSYYIFATDVGDNKLDVTVRQFGIDLSEDTPAVEYEYTVRQV